MKLLDAWRKRARKALDNWSPSSEIAVAEEKLESYDLSPCESGGIGRRPAGGSGVLPLLSRRNLWAPTGSLTLKRSTATISLPEKVAELVDAQRGARGGFQRRRSLRDRR